MMGTLLRRDVPFINLEAVRAAYEKAFVKDADNVLQAIRHNSLKALFAIRNVLVHKNGIVDKHFLDDRIDCDGNVWPELQKWAAIGIDEEIEIDGNDVKSLVESAFKSGSELIVSVDQWIMSHPK